MSRWHPEFGHGYVHTVSPEQAIIDGIAGRPYHMLTWTFDFCRRNKRDVVTSKQMHLSGVAIDRRTIQKYLRKLEKAGHIEMVSRGRWKILAFGRIGYKQGDGARNAAKIVPSAQSQKTLTKSVLEPLKDVFKDSSQSALLDQKDLSQKLKASEETLPSVALAPETVAAETAPAPEPVAAVEALPAPSPVAADNAKTQVARQAGLGKRQGGNIADTFLAMGVLASGKPLSDLLAMQSVDLDDLDTEAIFVQDREEAALLRASHAPARKASVKATEAPPPADPAPADAGATALQSTPQTLQRLPKSVIRHALNQMAEAIADFTYGEKEVNALRKWPITEAQLVDLKNAAVARKRQGKVTAEIGAYLFGAVRRASLGILPRRQSGGLHGAHELRAQAGPLR